MFRDWRVSRGTGVGVKRDPDQSGHAPEPTRSTRPHSFKDTCPLLVKTSVGEPVSRVSDEGGFGERGVPPMTPPREL